MSDPDRERREARDVFEGGDVVEREPTEITYAEQYYPARPRAFRPRARLRAGLAETAADANGEPIGTNPFYVSWLQKNSMLFDANTISAQLSGQGSMWQNPYARPSPQHAVNTAPVWLTAYPHSFVTRPGQSFLGTLAESSLWQAFQEVGIAAVHTGPVKLAGGVAGWGFTHSVDGHFDRISTRIDPIFGSEDEFREMCEVASQHGGTVIDDIVPGHTGKGPDFRLAEMKVGDYPGIFHMVEIPAEAWELLPTVPPGRDSVNLDAAAEYALARAGFIIGELQRVIFHDPGIKDTNWSATDVVVGPDGVGRRWVYLHYFKEGQPSINWLDPSFAGMRLVIGDALHSIGDLGSGALRLDANGFLGVEVSAEGLPAWSEGHPLSEAANHLIASMVRKVGGFTFQELNLTIDDIRVTSESGADLSYDFINRPAYHHALAMQDTEFLRLTLNESLAHGVAPVQLVHALQNHDELTYELVHFATAHKDDEFDYAGEVLTGSALASRIRRDLTEKLTAPQAPYNRVFTTNGIASTTASVIAAALGMKSVEEIESTDRERIRKAHLLLAMFNALQPGVFALSGWDICGCLPLPVEQVQHLVAGGDTRWIHRAAYDLMGYQNGDFPGMPLGQSLYGTLPDQLADPDSFACGLKRILQVRERCGLSTAAQVDVPPVSHPAMLVMVHKVAAIDEHQVTILNFSQEGISGSVQSAHLAPGSRLTDMFTGDDLGVVDALNSFAVELDAFDGMSVLAHASGDDR